MENSKLSSFSVKESHIRQLRTICDVMPGVILFVVIVAVICLICGMNDEAGITRGVIERENAVKLFTFGIAALISAPVLYLLTSFLRVISDMAESSIRQ